MAWHKIIYQKAMFVKFIIIILGLTLTLSACNSKRISSFPSHKMIVKQGNELDLAVLAQLQNGLSRAQVRALLGSPLLMDPFHQNRWDYVYQTTRNGIAFGEQKQLTIHFEGDSVSRFEGSALARIQPENITEEELITIQSAPIHTEKAKETL